VRWIAAVLAALLLASTAAADPAGRTSVVAGAASVGGGAPVGPARELQRRDDFSGRDVEVSCAKRFANLRVEHDGGKTYREVTLLWTRRRLVESGRGEGPVPSPSACLKPELVLAPGRPRLVHQAFFMK
jgi:hypothetical protein